MNTLKIIEASGSPYEIGYAHGSQGKAQVLCSIDTYKKMFKTYANLEWEEAKKRSRAYIDHIMAYDSDLLEEIRGVADGADVDLEDILALNARSEVILMTGSAVPSDGCTSMIALPEVTANHHTILAQNWDWKDQQIGAILVLKIKQSNKPAITMVTEGGIIGKIGFNDAGIGVCLNALGTVGNPNGLPLHVILRGILNSTKISDAVQAINGQLNACAANYLIASKIGEGLDIEKSPVDFEAFYPEDGIFTHANNYICDRMKPTDTLRFMAHDSFLRFNMAKKALKAVSGKITTDTCKEILRSHKDYPDSICRHNDEADPAGTRMCTVFSIVMDMTEGKMEVALGAPCENEYVEI